MTERRGKAEVRIEHGTWVIVADGEKFLLLHNAGDAEHPVLKVVDHDDNRNPPARDLSSDRPGRRHDASRQTPGGVAAWGKSAMEETDWHRVAEARFAEHVAAKLREWASAGRFRHLVVVADPRTLGELRGGYDDSLKATIVAEIDKDLTNLPLDRIEASLKAHASA